MAIYETMNMSVISDQHLNMTAVYKLMKIIPLSDKEKKLQYNLSAPTFPSTTMILLTTSYWYTTFSFTTMKLFFNTYCLTWLLT